MLKHLLKIEGGRAEWQSRRRTARPGQSSSSLMRRRGTGEAAERLQLALDPSARVFRVIRGFNGFWLTKLRLRPQATAAGRCSGAPRQPPCTGARQEQRKTHDTNVIGCTQNPRPKACGHVNPCSSSLQKLIRRRDYHSADTPLPSILKHLLMVEEGGPAEGQSRRPSSLQKLGYASWIPSRSECAAPNAMLLSRRPPSDAACWAR